MSDKRLKEPLLSSKSSKGSNPPPSEKTSAPPSPGFFSQAGLLTYKNLLITFKNPKNILFLIITPFILGLFLFAFQQLALKNGDYIIPNPEASSLPAFPACSWDNCVSLEVSLASSNPQATFDSYPWIDSVLSAVAAETGVTANKRTKVINSFADLQDYYSEIEQTPNQTQIGLLMCGDASETYVSDSLANYCQTPTKDYTYYLILKKINSMGVIFHALEEPFPIDPKASALKLSVDKAIINMNVDNPVDISVETARFPLAHNRYIHNFDIISQTGAFYFMIPGLFVFLFMQSEIVREKEYKLRQGLNIFGASHSAYWASWFVIALLYSLLASIFAGIAGLAYSFNFFSLTPLYITILLMFFPFCLAMAMMAFMVSALAPTTKAANASSYAVVLLAIVVESFVADNNILSLLFTDNASPLIQFLRNFLLFYPPFSYTKIFTNITMYSGYHYDIQEHAWNAGPHDYGMNDFTVATTGKLFTGDTYSRYSDLTSMFVLFADAVFFALLAWYFDNVVASNRGRGKSPIFFIHNLIALCKGEKKQKDYKTTIILKSKPIGQEEESAVRERNRVYENSERNIPAMGLRIKNLSKTFRGTCSKEEVHALNELTVEIEPGQLMGMLGHNGAGKTTLINVLTGVIAPDECEDTQIIINRRSITKMDEIRKYIGLCAQFDILWQELTAHQHLYLFASLKGIPKQQIQKAIIDLLELVGLSREVNDKVGGFSGGMKRRLSLAMAAIGNPKIILLDEPTTGLDPKVRQQVWALIGKLKANRSIILTTHSMEEADVLADRVCVMVKGRLRCIGSSLFLKELYGRGHRLTLNIDKAVIEKVTSSIKKLCPSSSIIDFKGGNLVVGIEEFENLIKIIKVLESTQPQGLEEYELKSAIRDWAVSHTTLEEVFMAVSREREEV